MAIEGCAFAAHGAPGIRVLSGRTLLQDCVVRCLSVWSGVHVLSGALCTLVGCEVEGAPGWFDATGSFHEAQPGVATFGTVIVSACTLRGGSSDHFVPGQPGQPAVGQPQAGLWLFWSYAYVTDATTVGGSSTGPVQTRGAPAANTGGTVHHARTLFVAGQGSGRGSTPGPAFVGAPRPQMVGIRRSGALRLGQTFTATARAGSSQGVLAFVGALGLSPTTTPITFLPVFLDTTTLVPLTVAVPQPGAQVAEAIALPNTPSLVGATLWLQAVQFDGAMPFATAPVVH